MDFLRVTRADDLDGFEGNDCATLVEVVPDVAQGLLLLK
jgi:hypothetical protein